MKDIKQELYKMVDEINISGLFNKIEEYESDGIVEIKNKPLLAQLKAQFIVGDNSFDFYDKLKTWISISIVIVTNTTNNINTMPSCEEIRNHIANSRTNKAIEIMLVLSKGTDSYNTVILLSGQFRELERSKNIGVIDASSAGIQLARITNALLNLLGDLCV